MVIWSIVIDMDFGETGANCLSYDFLSAFAKRFNTTHIDVNDWAFIQGCPTCGD